MNATNNVNRLGAIARTNVYDPDKNGGLLAVQEALARKVVTELSRFDNLYYELCNEPYFGGVTPQWQQLICEAIVQTEQGLGKRHLISRNIACSTTWITRSRWGMRTAVSSFRPPSPAGAGRRLRRELRFLSEFMRRFDLARLRPQAGLVGGVCRPALPPGLWTNPGRTTLSTCAARRDWPGTAILLPLNMARGKWCSKPHCPRDTTAPSGLTRRTAAASATSNGPIPAVWRAFPLRPLRRTWCWHFAKGESRNWESRKLKSASDRFVAEGRLGENLGWKRPGAPGLPIALGLRVP